MGIAFGFIAGLVVGAVTTLIAVFLKTLRDLDDDVLEESTPYDTETEDRDEARKL